MVDVLLAPTCPFTSVCTLVYVHVLYIYTLKSHAYATHTLRNIHTCLDLHFSSHLDPWPMSCTLWSLTSCFETKSNLTVSLENKRPNPGLSSGPTGNFLRAIRKWWGVFCFSIVWSSEEDEARWKIAPKKRVCDCHLGGIHRRPLLRMLRGDNCFSKSHSSTWSTGPDKQWPWGSCGSS